MAKHSQILPFLFLMRRVRHRDARFMRYPPFGRPGADMSRGASLGRIGAASVARRSAAISGAALST